RHIIVAAELIEPFLAALPHLAGAATIWLHGTGHGNFPRIDLDVERHAGEPLARGEGRPPTIEDRALYIYTSGTTGLPKAAKVSHFRLMQWSYWFAGLMGVRGGDRMYDCLPMYHSVGGVVAPGAALVGGASVVLRERFSAREFWSDVVRWDCTLFQYIGELCRYLLHAEPAAGETQHRIRLACGNGLRPDVWDDFKRRFGIPRILEFYAATEGNVSLFNVDGKPGAIGRMPPFLAHRVPAALVRFDVTREAPVRGAQGRCVRCAANAVGEAVGKILEDEWNPDGRAGMAAVVPDAGLDLAAFRAHLTDRLPGYACPSFLRIRCELDVTTTFKHAKYELVGQGYDPAASADVVYFNDPERGAFVQLDQALYDGIQTGRIRL